MQASDERIRILCRDSDDAAGRESRLFNQRMGLTPGPRLLALTGIEHCEIDVRGGIELIDQRAGRPCDPHSAVDHDGDSITQLGRLFEIMGRIHDRLAQRLQSPIDTCSSVRAAGSKPAAGSSRMRMSVLPTTARLNARRRFCPPESFEKRWPRWSRSPANSIASSGFLGSE